MLANDDRVIVLQCNEADGFVNAHMNAFFIDSHRAKKIMLDYMYSRGYQDVNSGVGYDTKSNCYRYCAMSSVVDAWRKFCYEAFM